MPKDVLNEAWPKLSSEPSQRAVEEALRAEGVRYLPPRRKIYITEADAVKRFGFAWDWADKPASFWTSKVRAYLDHKRWPFFPCC